MADQATDYEDLYRAHRARVLRLCQLLLGDADEAHDVSQDVFLKLHRALLSPGEEPVTWAAWLTTVAVNACRDRRRSRWWRWWRTSEEFAEAEHIAPGPSPEQSAVAAETRQRIWHAFSALPARQREVFALRHLQGWSTDEVATALQLSPGSVKRHLFRAVHRMRRALGDPR